MSIPRSELVDPFSIQILHVFNRCVRRAFLCGVDSVSGRDYSHRKEWIRRRLEFLTGIFAFDIATYAVMSNHFHLVVRSRPDIVAGWSNREVAIRNMRLQGKSWFRVDGTLRKSADAEIERIVNDPEEIQRLRKKLSDVSKLMFYFDRNLAVRANREDKINGAFWEGTFKAELIEDEASLLACMAYVDLNPIRAMMAQTLQESEYTGAYDRIAELRKQLATGELVPIQIGKSLSDEVAATNTNSDLPPVSSTFINAWEQKDHPMIGWLAPIRLDERVPERVCKSNGRRPSSRGFLSISLLKYLEVVEWSGRQIRHDKKGAIPPGVPSVFSQLGIKGPEFIESIMTHASNDRYFAATERQGIPEESFDVLHSTKTVVAKVSS